MGKRKKRGRGAFIRTDSRNNIEISSNEDDPSSTQADSKADLNLLEIVEEEKEQAAEITEVEAEENSLPKEESETEEPRRRRRRSSALQGDD